MNYIAYIEYKVSYITNWTQPAIELPTLKHPKIEASLTGSDARSDGGVLFLREIDHPYRLNKR